MKYNADDACGVGDRVLSDARAAGQPLQAPGYFLGNKSQLETVTLVRVPGKSAEGNVAGLVFFDGIPLYADSDDHVYTMDPEPRLLFDTDYRSLHGATSLQIILRNGNWLAKLINPCFASLPEAAANRDIPALETVVGDDFQPDWETLQTVARLVGNGNIAKFLASRMGLYAYYRQNRPFPAVLDIALEHESPEVQRALQAEYLRHGPVWRNLHSPSRHGMPLGWLSQSIASA